MRCLKRRLPFLSACVPAVLFLLRCDHAPTGFMKDERKLVVFSVLNPAVRTQKLIVQQSLTFDEGQSDAVHNAGISGVSGALTGPDARYEMRTMPAGTDQGGTQSIQHDTDFLRGGDAFNYIFDGPPVECGKTYRLSLSRAGYPSISAEATVPGPFKITEINIEPEFSRDDLRLDMGDWSAFSGKYVPDPFRITWSKSEKAAGYWLDLSVLEYDIPPELRLVKNGGSWTWPDFDSTRVLDIPYKEYPVRFPQAEDNQVRGYLTPATSFEIPLAELLRLIDLPRPFETRFERTYRMRVHVHALNQSLYAYFMENAAAGDRVGEVKTICDMNFIENGYGIFGAACTQSATARLYDYILGLNTASATPAEYFYWYSKFNDVYSLDQIFNDGFSASLFPLGLKPPLPTGPENEAALAPGNDLVLTWSAVENAAKYVVVLKPSYLWFQAGNVVFLSDENRREITWQDVPYRDCRIEWYVKAIASIDDHGAIVVEPPLDKAPLVYSNEIASPWSDSRFIRTESGSADGFESRIPRLVKPQNRETISPGGALAWEAVDGADAYLVFVVDDLNQTIIAVTEEAGLSPPFAGESDLIDGLIGASRFQPGRRYSCQICALRVKAGALGFAVDHPPAGGLPGIFPRRRHPSGIILQSRWSNPVDFQVQ